MRRIFARQSTSFATSLSVVRATPMRYNATTAAAAAPSEPIDPKLTEMAKAYSKLSIKEFTALQRAIFIELGYTPEFYEQALLKSIGGGGGGGGVVMQAAPVAAAAPTPAAAAPPPPEEPKQEQTSFDVKLVEYPADAKVKLIKEIRTVISSLSLMDAKSTIEKGGVIAKKLGKEDAQKLKTAFETHKAKVEII
eukprot:PhF_6_TR4617/c0_g1_i1/m.6470/K02935/RP-L7, MRPL12, rplL; large subunit ribosomal protein L7/L12